MSTGVLVLCGAPSHRAETIRHGLNALDGGRLQTSDGLTDAESGRGLPQSRTLTRLTRNHFDYFDYLPMSE